MSKCSELRSVYQEAKYIIDNILLSAERVILLRNIISFLNHLGNQKVQMHVFIL